MVWLGTLKKLLSEAESVSSNALTGAKLLNGGDASAIFETLSQKIREEGKQSGDKSSLRRLFNFCKERTELMSQLVGFLEKFHDKDLPVSVVTWLQEATHLFKNGKGVNKIINWLKSVRLN